MHPQRLSLHNELHARPSLYFDEPAHVFYLAFLGGEAEYNTLLKCLPLIELTKVSLKGITTINGHPPPDAASTSN
jgi:hypothetical protein